MLRYMQNEKRRDKKEGRRRFGHASVARDDEGAPGTRPPGDSEDRLESRGLVTREAHESDRRARIVRLTARGEEEAAKVFAGHKTAMDLAASGLSKTERATLIQLLKKLGTSAGDSAAPQHRR